MTIAKKIKITLNIIFILFALFISLQFIFKKYATFINSLPHFFKRSLHEKYVMTDGKFYEFAAFCIDKIPLGSEVIFYNSLEMYRKFYPINNAYFLFDYHKQRIKFYLYPIKVHILALGKQDIGRPWEIPEDQEAEIFKRVDFIIAHYLDRDFPGFKLKYRLGSDYAILEKE